eukprot:CAMPEP_0173456286 /NCGR_PEP_ID=MMETSP1357-20121228/55746_1 /TAXON_ID=77926 /ORGANISM="Hemiselmis rufescens, Strain PCC563" /LENGTH=108 /DNA_ID=CAMNT_0014423487 /DNA_START=44 /DNA_END=371 /DNA_ORIENTATION=+
MAAPPHSSALPSPLSTDAHSHPQRNVESGGWLIRRPDLHLEVVCLAVPTLWTPSQDVCDGGVLERISQHVVNLLLLERHVLLERLADPVVVRTRLAREPHAVSLILHP